ncbi:MAG: glycosyl transferase family 2, partial [Bryobacteraceae bacterium]
QMLLLDLPLILACFCSIFVFYTVAQRELFPRTWKRSIFLLPALLAAGVGLTVINTRAVIEALLGKQSSFVRTPKYAVAGKAPRTLRQKYRRKSGWLPWIELAIGTYFLGMVAFAIETYNFFSLPFLLLFVVGYYWAGFATLAQEYRDRLRAARQRRLEWETAH